MSTPVVTLEGVGFTYNPGKRNSKTIFEGVHLTIGAGQMVLVEVGGSDEITLDKEHTEYKWVGKEEFVEEIDWFGHKEKLKRLLMDLLS